MNVCAARGMNIANWVCRMVTVHWWSVSPLSCALFIILMYFPCRQLLSCVATAKVCIYVLHTQYCKYDCNLKQSFKVYSIDFLLLFRNTTERKMWHITLRWNSWMSCPSHTSSINHSECLFLCLLYILKKGLLGPHNFVMPGMPTMAVKKSLREHQNESILKILSFPP